MSAPSVQPCELPEGALLAKYQHGGSFADCYVSEVGRGVSHAEYVEAFYTTALFKVERRLLSWFVAMPSTDEEARRLAAGNRDSFAAWSVEARSENQLLMTDLRGHTRSWFMVAGAGGGANDSTRLYFGSAVVGTSGGGPGASGLAFRSLLGFHKLYSRALLFAARARLAKHSR